MFPLGVRPLGVLHRVKPGDTQDRRHRRVEFLERRFEVEHRIGRQVGLRRREPGGHHGGGSLDQRAARFAGHALERIEQMAQLAELQRPGFEAPSAQGDTLGHHRAYSLTLKVPIVPVGSANALKSNSWIS
jgi:hypothetical protein